MDDAELLAQYAADRSEVAFSELVRRQVDFVYSAALRQLGGNHHLAQDVTQMVFVDLARKASALARHPALFAWLHRTTRYAVFNTRRKEARRSALNKSLAEDPSMAPLPEPSWHEVGPVLDEVVDELPEKDRAAVLLRFFARKPFAEVGRELGLSENAARMRVDRAVEALRRGFERRGIHSTTAALGALVTAHGLNAAPVSVVPSVSVAITASGAPMSAALSTLYTMSKIKTVAAVAMVAIGAISFLVEAQSHRGLRAEAARLRVAGRDFDQAKADNRQSQDQLQGIAAANPEAGELARTRKRIAVLKARPEGVTEARMKPVALSGQATPEATFVTLLTAINNGDVAAAERMIRFRDGQPSEQERTEFMAMFDEPIRRRYQTPEQVFLAAYFSLVSGMPPELPSTAYQVLDAEQLLPGVMKVHLWMSGPRVEWQERLFFQQAADEWSISVRPLTKQTANELRRLLDPGTGLPKPKQP